MPPFRLEALRNTDFPKRRQQILYTKKLYHKDVKITDWQKYLESQPIDYNPYCPGELNYFRSHYKRLGDDPDEPYLSETHRMLTERFEKSGPILEPNKYLVNFYSYPNECQPKETQQCPADVSSDYITTMQSSYTVPFPYQMQRFALPKTPYLKNRKLKNELPEHCTTKFYDDDFNKNSGYFRCIKKAQWISYNPCTALYNDGTPQKVKERKCFMLEY